MLLITLISFLQLFHMLIWKTACCSNSLTVMGNWSSKPLLKMDFSRLIDMIGMWFGWIKIKVNSLMTWMNIKKLTISLIHLKSLVKTKWVKSYKTKKILTFLLSHLSFQTNMKNLWKNVNLSRKRVKKCIGLWNHQQVVKEEEFTSLILLPISLNWMML